MENRENGSWKWTGIAIAGLLLILGLWWWGSGQSGTTSPSTSTASTTSETSGAGQVTIETKSQDVASVVAGVENGGRFNQLLAQSGVSLAGKGPYTVFVATDGAFGRLVPGTINNMSAAELKRTMQYHIVSGKRLDVDAVSSGQIQALSKDMLNFQVDAAKGAVYVNSGYVLHAYKATNGIVYVINQVLIPPQQTP